MITTQINTSSEHLLRLITATGIKSAEELSETVGVHLATVYRWLNGEARIPLAVIRYLEMKEKYECLKKNGAIGSTNPTVHGSPSQNSP